MKRIPFTSFEDLENLVIPGEDNEIWVGNNRLVRIPRVEGKMVERERNGVVAVEYTYERSYDKEKKQSRCRRVTIGTKVTSHLMMPNDRYHEYFDRKGLPLGSGSGTQAIPEEIKGDFSEAWEQLDPEEKEAPEPEEEEVQRQPQAAAQVRSIADAAPEGTEEKETEQKSGEERKIKEGKADLKERKAAQRAREAEQRAREEEAARRAEEIRQQEEEMREYARYLQFKDSFDLLYSIFYSHYDILRDQTRKKPETPMSLIKIRKINQNILEIRKLLEGMEIVRYLEPLEEPVEEEIGGVRTLRAITNSDTEIILAQYNSVLEWYKYRKVLTFESWSS